MKFESINEHSFNGTYRSPQTQREIERRIEYYRQMADTQADCSGEFVLHSGNRLVFLPPPDDKSKSTPKQEKYERSLAMFR